ncbi:MAG TPA: YfhO family protein, partial [Vicinamibacterales bacterium]|nr:YfhO family protein [Vicinamibacterales bacterium]
LDLALNVEILLGYVCALAGMYWFLRRLNLAPHGALFGAMTFALGGFMLAHYPHVNMIGVVAHMPWIIACCDVLIVDDRRSRGAAAYAGIALLIGSQALLGFPQAVWWTLLAATAFVIWRAWTTRRAGRAIAAAAAGATGLLVGAVQFMPTLSAAAGSSRVLESTSFMLSYSLHPVNVMQLWAPQALRLHVYSAEDKIFFHEFALYPTAFLVLAPVWVWMRRASLPRHRSIIAAASAFAAVMFLLALGHYGELAKLLLYVPAVGSFRAPARYIMLMQFALATLAAIAFEDLAEVPASGGVALSPTVVVILVCYASASVLTLLTINLGLVRLPSDMPAAPFMQALPETLAVCGAIVLFVVAARGVKWALPLLVILTAVDLGAWGLYYIHRTWPVRLPEFTMKLQPNDTGRPLRLAGPPNWGNVPLLLGYQLVGGYVGLYPETTLPWEGEAFSRLAGARRRFDARLHVSDVTDGVARARLLPDARVSADPLDDIARIDLAQTAILTAPVQPLGGAPGTATMVTDRPGHLRVQTTATGRQLLSLSERYDPGWSATIDGLAAPPIAINADFLGIVVEAGTHDVDLQFAPKAFARGRLLSIAGLVALVAGVFVMLRR